MTPDGQIAIPLDIAAIREPFLPQAESTISAPCHGPAHRPIANWLRLFAGVLPFTFPVV